MKPKSNTDASADRDKVPKASRDLDKNNQQLKSPAQGGPGDRSDTNAGKRIDADDPSKEKRK